MSDRVTLLPIDIADIMILVDNFVDILLPGTEMVRRAPLVWNWSEREQLIAEHGYSLLLTVQPAMARQAPTRIARYFMFIPRSSQGGAELDKDKTELSKPEELCQLRWKPSTIGPATSTTGSRTISAAWGCSWWATTARWRT